MPRSPRPSPRRTASAPSIDAKAGQLAAAQSQAAAAAAREAELSGVLAEGQRREAELEVQVQQTQSHLQRTRARLHSALGRLAARLVAIYKGDSPDATQLLLSADGFDDLANRAELLSHIEEADATLAARVRWLRDQVAAQLAAVKEARARAIAFNQRIAVARDQIAAVRANAEAQAAQLEQARAAQAAALSSLQAQVSTWEQQVQEAQQVSADAGAGDRLELVRRLGDPAGDRNVRVRRQLRGGQPVLGRRGRIPDPALDLESLRRPRRAPGRLAPAPERDRRPDLGRLRVERLGVRAVAAG